MIDLFTIDPASLPIAFLVFTGMVALAVANMLLRTFRGGGAIFALLGLGGWLGVVGALNWLGFLSDPNRRPPGMALLAGPVFALAILVATLPWTGRRLASSISLGSLIGFQAFRVGVEFTVNELHGEGLVPRLLTLPGGNFEFLIALSAPIAAWIATRGPGGRRLALAWNVAGLVSLANVGVRAVLSTPGPLNLLHAEIPNVAFGMFPYGLIPCFMAPLAVGLHLLSMRALRLAARMPYGPSTQFAA